MIVNVEKNCGRGCEKCELEIDCDGTVDIDVSCGWCEQGFEHNAEWRLEVLAATYPDGRSLSVEDIIYYYDEIEGAFVEEEGER